MDIYYVDSEHKRTFLKVLKNNRRKGPIKKTTIACYYILTSTALMREVALAVYRGKPPEYISNQLLLGKSHEGYNFMYEMDRLYELAICFRYSKSNVYKTEYSVFRAWNTINNTKYSFSKEGYMIALQAYKLFSLGTPVFYNQLSRQK